MGDLITHFSKVSDKRPPSVPGIRKEQGKRHQLMDIIAIAIIGVICGADDRIKEIAKMTKGQAIAIDGKTVRRSHDRANGKRPLHLVSAWASKNELVIGHIQARF